MKKFATLSASLVLCFTLSSCFTYSVTVGDGPQSGIEVTKKNTYLIYGLVPLTMQDSKEMAGGASDYEVLTTQTFVDGLVSAITFGIFNPVTVVVTK